MRSATTLRYYFFTSNLACNPELNGNEEKEWGFSVHAKSSPKVHQASLPTLFIKL